jgi:pimeloyl-ACP methyl ester carboxylesterase
MPMLRELRAAGMAALQVPHALRRHGCASAHYVAERNAHYPVVLVHGYAGTASVWAPLRGALAGAGFGHIVSARIMHPGHRCTRPGAGAPGPARWLAYYSDGDHIVPPSSARLDGPGYQAANLLIPGSGHLTICGDARLIRSLVSQLIRTETSAAPAVPDGAGRQLAAA